MTINARFGSLVGLAATAVLSLFISMAQAQAPLSISPNTVKPGATPVVTAVTVSSTGFFDLSQIRASQIGIIPRDGISNIQVSNAAPRQMTLSFTLAGNAPAGDRSLMFTVNEVTVSLKLRVVRDLPVCSPGNCAPPKTCEGGICIAPRCDETTCRSPRACHAGVCRTERTCTPRCRNDQICNDGLCVSKFIR